MNTNESGAKIEWVLSTFPQIYIHLQHFDNIYNAFLHISYFKRRLIKIFFRTWIIWERFTLQWKSKDCDVATIRDLWSGFSHINRSGAQRDTLVLFYSSSAKQSCNWWSFSTALPLSDPPTVAVQQPVIQHTTECIENNANQMSGESFGGESKSQTASRSGLPSEFYSFTMIQHLNSGEPAVPSPPPTTLLF